MNNVRTYLEQLGFSEIEAKLYTILLKSGPLTVAALAEKSKINRTATYSHINSLLQKGIIAKVKGSANKIAANPPDHLHYLVEQKAIQIGMLQEKLPSVISILNNSLPTFKSESKSEIKYYKGKAGIKAIYQDSLLSDKIRAYFNPGELRKIFPENVKLVHETLQKNPKKQIFEIATDTPQARSHIAYSKETKERQFWKLLPDDVNLTANDILIYDGKVAIINIRDRNNMEGVILENHDYYNNSVQLFDLLWRMLPEPEE